MFCLFGASECPNPFGADDGVDMHSSEPLPVAPATGPILLQQLGRLIIRARSASPHRSQRDTRDRLLQAKLRAANPSTSSQVLTQPKAELGQRGVEAQLDSHVQALWTEQIPVCIEVLLSPDCSECAAALSRVDDEECERLPAQRGLLLERWTMTPLVHKSHERPAFITSQWLLNAVRSQLHFSQISAWMHTLKGDEDNPTERRRKLSREQCNIKKIESNCDDIDQNTDERKLNVVYSIKIPGESYKMSEFTKPPTDHAFPVTDIGNNVYLKVNLESLPRLDEIPNVKCKCQKRRASKEISVQSHDELLGKLNDLSLTGQQKYEMNNINSNTGTSSRRLSIITNPNLTEFLFKSAEDVNLNKGKSELLDDRMHTNCSENGKHKCSCDDDSDRPVTDFKSEPKKVDEKRLKEIAKYKRRIRKENLKKLYDSTSSEGEGIKKEKHTSIPILQASRFDRFRAIGCYRNQTYLTLPASRMESRSPFIDAMSIPPAEYRKTVSVSTQTDDLICQCGVEINMKCDECRMVRSNANYDLASINVNEDKRKIDDDTKSSKKLKCDNFISIKCDMLDDVSTSDSLIKRPKYRRYLPFVDRFDRVISDRLNKESDLEQLHLKSDDTVFSTPKPEKRQKTFSVGDDYVMYEKCDYGTIDRCEIESPKDEGGFTPPESGFKYPESGIKNSENDGKNSKNDVKNSENGIKNSERGANLEPSSSGANVNGSNPDAGSTSNGHDGEQSQIPSPSEMDRFRWRFDSAASMVFHTKTGLPLTSSPAPLRRGNNCFDFDDSINGISGIKSALFHPIACGVSPKVAPSPAPSVSAHRQSFKKLNLGPSTGLLGSFEESALKGRLEPVATVAGFTAELGASGACCPPHRRLPVTVFFYAPGGTNAPYMGHINLGASGYRVSRSGTIQVSLFNPHGTLVKMFVVLYDLTCMPPNARTFLRQRTLYMPAGAEAPAPHHLYKWLRYLIHLRFMTSKSGKLYLHTDIRILVSRKADMDTATAHSALFRPIPTNHSAPAPPPTNQGAAYRIVKPPTNQKSAVNVKVTDDEGKGDSSRNRSPIRVFGGCSDYDESKMPEIGYENQNGVSYELRSFTYAPENPRFSLR